MSTVNPNATHVVPGPTIYVDESGDAGTKSLIHNKKYPYFIMGFCYYKNPVMLNRKMHKILLKHHKNGIYPDKLHEIKFYPTPALRKLGYTKDEIRTLWELHYPKIRDSMIQVILDYSDGIFAGIIDKNAINPYQQTTAQLGNSIFQRSLFEHITPSLPDNQNLTIIHDRGRLNPRKTKEFNQSILYNDSIISQGVVLPRNGIQSVQDVDSLKAPGIWTSDFIAGAFHLWKQGGNDQYVNLLRPKFIGKGYREF